MNTIDLKEPNSFIFDFDSTLVTLETLDTLVKNSITDNAQKEQIDEITRACMNGELDFNTSLTTRLKVASLHAKDFQKMADGIHDYITEGIFDVVRGLQERGQKVFIISGGFTETILPIAKAMDIPFDHCFANDYAADETGKIIGVKESPLAHELGKNAIVKKLKEDGHIAGRSVMIGDGMSDYSVFETKDADVFIGCGFNVIRGKVKEKSIYFAKTVEELSDLLFKKNNDKSMTF